MILSKMSLKRRKDFLAEHPQTAKVIAALRATAGGATPMWLERDESPICETAFIVHITCLPSASRHGDPKPDPVHVAIHATQRLFPERAEAKPLHQVQVHYERHQILVARGAAVIHWITKSNERVCADALGELDSDAILEDIQAAFTLPHPASEDWDKTEKFADDHTLAMWEVPATGYIVEIRDDRQFPVLRDPAGNWVPKTWWTLQEIADIHGYTPSSLRVAIQQNRLHSSKWGYTHRVAASELRAALREGRLRPRD
jgi:hypothetical protein